MRYEARATINAPAERVWRIITDAPNAASWDSGILRIDGRIAPGETIRLVSSVNPGRTFPLRVTAWEEPRQMIWTGGMPLGLFRGVRTFTLTPRGDVTDFTVREEFSGPLLPLLGRTLPDLGPSFEQYARGLKAHAEEAG